MQDKKVGIEAQTRALPKLRVRDRFKPKIPTQALAVTSLSCDDAAAGMPDEMYHRIMNTVRAIAGDDVEIHAPLSVL